MRVILSPTAYYFFSVAQGTRRTWPAFVRRPIDFKKIDRPAAASVPGRPSSFHDPRSCAAIFIVVIRILHETLNLITLLYLTFNIVEVCNCGDYLWDENRSDAITSVRLGPESVKLILWSGSTNFTSEGHLDPNRMGHPRNGSNLKTPERNNRSFLDRI